MESPVVGAGEAGCSVVCCHGSVVVEVLSAGDNCHSHCADLKSAVAVAVVVVVVIPAAAAVDENCDGLPSPCPSLYLYPYLYFWVDGHWRSCLVYLATPQLVIDW